MSRSSDEKKLVWVACQYHEVTGYQLGLCEETSGEKTFLCWFWKPKCYNLVLSKVSRERKDERNPEPRKVCGIRFVKIKN